MHAREAAHRHLWYHYAKNFRRVNAYSWTIHRVKHKRETDVKNLKKSDACRQRETRETDKAVVAVETTVQNQEVGVDCSHVQWGRRPSHDQDRARCERAAELPAEKIVLSADKTDCTRGAQCYYPRKSRTVKGQEAQYSAGMHSGGHRHREDRNTGTRV